MTFLFLLFTWLVERKYNPILNGCIETIKDITPKTTLLPADNTERHIAESKGGYQSDFEAENYEVEDCNEIDGMEGHDFEYFCAELFRKNGFSHVSVTRGSGDQGVDILAKKDGKKYAVQCKNYYSNVGNGAVQEVFAGKAFYHCDVAVVLTNSYFTVSAIELARSIDVELWDRKELQKMIRNAKKH